MPQGTSDCFRYKSLQGVGAIRLLALQPSPEQQEPLSGALVHTTLDECLDDLIGGYTALSYVWGLPDKTHSIHLGQDEVQITASLDASLRALRDRARVHLIWADALCINQDDIPERNVQVSMMGQIYWTARNTVIYLGEETEATAIILTAAQRRHTLDEQAVGTVSRLHDEVAEDYIGFNFQQDEQDEQDEKVGGPDSPVSFVESSKATDAFDAKHELSKVLRQAAQMDLLRRPWFHRVWIYQELVLSRQPWVQCGQQRVWWSDLCNLLLPVIGDSFGDSFVKDMDDVRCSFHSSGQGKLGMRGWGLRDLWEGNRPLWEILHSRRGSQATDPRDMVFGFMSLHSDRDRVMRRI
ncbi:uncharacterized protein E0L32_006912 [Thyridium curvatum]|uniref:Heterokaryon incompatibility domain-containing protein n=1 Tax=Thyridium curvatum TaxID=1093900 RepID=A0A507B779_9PEZI|nr:uncharacterized protein E0L32_006912 [Thyridium curvatum]TPX12500.1 hypothetical protein E0L32_006912 [Thyridium curvatum]